MSWSGNATRDRTHRLLWGRSEIRAWRGATSVRFQPRMGRWEACSRWREELSGRPYCRGMALTKATRRSSGQLSCPSHRTRVPISCTLCSDGSGHPFVMGQSRDSICMLIHAIDRSRRIYGCSYTRGTTLCFYCHALMDARWTPIKEKRRAPDEVMVPPMNEVMVAVTLVLEDETGRLPVAVHPQLAKQMYRRIRQARVVVVSGRVERISWYRSMLAMELREWYC
jgi:hypothetical protein